jgi:hypothetical protein
VPHPEYAVCRFISGYACGQDSAATAGSFRTYVVKALHPSSAQII